MNVVILGNGDEEQSGRTGFSSRTNIDSMRRFLGLQSREWKSFGVRTTWMTFWLGPASTPRSWVGPSSCAANT